MLLLEEKRRSRSTHYEDKSVIIKMLTGANYKVVRADILVMIRAIERASYFKSDNPTYFIELLLNIPSGEYGLSKP